MEKEKDISGRYLYLWIGYVIAAIGTVTTNQPIPLIMIPIVGIVAYAGYLFVKWIKDEKSKEEE